MKEVVADPKMIAKCGLYCGACKSYLKGKCGGCAANENATWCKVRSCCKENNYRSCADCKQFENAVECKKFNNFMSKMIGLLLNSDRKACINLIKEIGYDDFSLKMAHEKIQTIKRKK